LKPAIDAIIEIEFGNCSVGRTCQ